MADNEFGYTAWGMDWVRLAEPITQTRPDPLLPRARSIARNGGVQLAIDGRIIRAAIHRGAQASVTHLEVSPMPRPAILAVSHYLPPRQAVPTDEIHRAITKAGYPPAPTLTGVDCSCAARTSRCLHVLACYYAMAQRVDEDPRIALQIQDFSRAASADSDAQVAAEPQRWSALNALNPADYFVRD